MGPIEFLLRHIESGWRTIVEAPGAAVGLIVLTLVCAHLYYRNHIAVLNERLKLRDDELARYKEKLQGATPDEVKAELELLRSRLANQEAQIAALEKKLKQVDGKATYAAFIR